MTGRTCGVEFRSDGLLGRRSSLLAESSPMWFPAFLRLATDFVFCILYRRATVRSYFPYEALSRDIFFSVRLWNFRSSLFCLLYFYD